MRDQLVFLLQLQQSDVKVRELETAANQLPAKLDPLRRDLAKLQTMLDAERAKLTETDNWRKAQQDMIDKDRELLKSAQTKLQASKNSKDFGAASREVENRRKSITDREAELKKVVEASASSTAQMLTRDKDVEGVRTELTTSEDAQSGSSASSAPPSPPRSPPATPRARRSTSSGSRSTTRSPPSAGTRSPP